MQDPEQRRMRQPEGGAWVRDVQAIGGAVGGGRTPVRRAGGGGTEATRIGCTTTMRGGGAGGAATDGGGSAVKFARMQEAHFRLSIGVGFSGRGAPSAS